MILFESFVDGLGFAVTYIAVCETGFTRHHSMDAGG